MVTGAGMAFYDDHASLYDLAFSWPVHEEVEWLLARMGPGVRSVLEPGCGSGRMFPAFARRGIRITGIDISRAMLQRAARRMSALRLSGAQVEYADMTRFDLGRLFDGALCPINTFGYLLTDEAALSHLRSVARHLPEGRRYLLQVDVCDAPIQGDSAAGSWIAEQGGVRLRTTWGSDSFDIQSRVETQYSRFEVLAGPGQGTVVTEKHHVRRWNWQEWQALVSASPFQEIAAYDGNVRHRDQLQVGPTLEGKPLVWHELIRTST